MAFRQGEGEGCKEGISRGMHGALHCNGLPARSGTAIPSGPHPCPALRATRQHGWSTHLRGMERVRGPMAGFSFMAALTTSFCGSAGEWKGGKDIQAHMSEGWGAKREGSGGWVGGQQQGWRGAARQQARHPCREGACASHSHAWHSGVTGRALACTMRRASTSRICCIVLMSSSP